MRIHQLLFAKPQKQQQPALSDAARTKRPGSEDFREPAPSSPVEGGQWEWPELGPPVWLAVTKGGSR